MATFWLAIVWGLGASLGAAVGLITFALAIAFLEGFTGKTMARLVDHNVKALQALERRNELTKDTIAALNRIADNIRQRQYDGH